MVDLADFVALPMVRVRLVLVVNRNHSIHLQSTATQSSRDKRCYVKGTHLQSAWSLVRCHCWLEAELNAEGFSAEE